MSSRSRARSGTQRAMAACSFARRPTIYRVRGLGRGEGVHHRRHHRLGRDGVPLRAGGALAQGLQRLAVEPRRLGGHGLLQALALPGGLLPDRRGDGPGLDDGDVYPPRPHLHAQRVGERLQRELGRGVGAYEGRGHAPADRAHVDDAPSRDAEQRQHRLGHRDLADHVDLQLAAEISEGQELERPRHHDAGIVHEAGEPAASHHGGHRARRARDGGGVGDVDRHRGEQRRGLALQRGAVGRSPDSGEDTPAQAIEAERAGRADAGGGPGDEHGVWVRARAGRAPSGRAHPVTRMSRRYRTCRTHRGMCVRPEGAILAPLLCREGHDMTPKNLEVFVGKWKKGGRAHASPFGPAGDGVGGGDIRLARRAKSSSFTASMAGWGTSRSRASRSSGSILRAAAMSPTPSTTTATRTCGR